jgi:hypothetical protein
MVGILHRNRASALVKGGRVIFFGQLLAWKKGRRDARPQRVKEKGKEMRPEVDPMFGMAIDVGAAHLRNTSSVTIAREKSNFPVE